MALATLTFGPLVGYVPKRANLPLSPRRLPLLLPSNSALLKTLGKGDWDCSRHFRQERRGLSSVPTVRAVAVDSDKAGSSDPVIEVHFSFTSIGKLIIMGLKACFLLNKFVEPNLGPSWNFVWKSLMHRWQVSDLRVSLFSGIRLGCYCCWFNKQMSEWEELCFFIFFAFCFDEHKTVGKTKEVLLGSGQCKIHAWWGGTFQRVIVWEAPKLWGA